MTRSIQRWSPDHCDCSILVEFDPDDETFVPVQVDVARQQQLRAELGYAAVREGDETLEQQCEAHAHLDRGPHYAAVLAENQMKNRLHAVTGELFADAGPGLRLPSDTSRQVAPPLDYTFHPTTRLLTIRMPALTAEEKAILQAWADGNLGPDKVTVT